MVATGSATAEALDVPVCGSVLREVDCVGGTQLGWEYSGILCGTLECFPSLRLCVSMLPGTCWVETLGDNGCLL